MSTLPTKAMFETLYTGQAPWDVAWAQKPFVDASDQIKGAVLDVGCGTGELALFFAGRGHKVTGIDFLEVPIERAKKKAAERGLNATFLVKDVLTLADMAERFDTITDSGLFHVFSDDDRKRYAENVAAVLNPGGRLFLMCFSDEEPGNQGPRRVSQQEIRATFSDGWTVESIEPAHYEVLAHPSFTFSEGGPKSWFAVIRRNP